MNISFYFDVVCPWCFIGHQRLLSALKPLPADKVHIRYCPFQLAPDLTADIPMDDYSQKQGMDPAIMKQGEPRVIGIGKSVGIQFDYSAPRVMFNTVNAHRVIQNTPVPRQTAMVTALFQGRHQRGLGYGDPNVLARVASEAGAGSVAEVLAFVKGDLHRDAVVADSKHATTLPIITVPFMMVNDRFPVQFLHLENVAEFAVNNLFEG